MILYSFGPGVATSDCVCIAVQPAAASGGKVEEAGSSIDVVLEKRGGLLNELLAAVKKYWRTRMRH